MKRNLLLAATSLTMLSTTLSFAQTDADNFYKSSTVSTEKVTFLNQYKMKVTGNLFLPQDMKESERYPAIIVGHPMGAVKEQSANLYATKMAERGFITLSIDLSFWGESEGEPRNAVLPELYAESFSAAVDYLGTHPSVNREHIGVIGICGSGSFAISAAKIDPRLKAIATISMYNMGTASRKPETCINTGTKKTDHCRSCRTTLCGILRWGNEIYRWYSTRTNRKLLSDRTRVLRILSYRTRRVYTRRCNITDYYTSHIDKQREIHEFLSVC